MVRKRLIAKGEGKRDRARRGTPWVRAAAALAAATLAVGAILGPSWGIGALPEDREGVRGETPSTASLPWIRHLSHVGAGLSVEGQPAAQAQPVVRAGAAAEIPRTAQAPPSVRAGAAAENPRTAQAPPGDRVRAAAENPPEAQPPPSGRVGTMAENAPLVHHALRVRIDPEAGRLEAEDAIALPPRLAGRGPRVVRFLLHAGLNPESPSPGVRIVREGRTPEAADFGAAGEPLDLAAAPPLELFAAELPAGAAGFSLRYRGTIAHTIQTDAEEMARGFSGTPGLISGDGVFLSGGSYWYPWFGDDLVVFSLEVELPPGWDAVSQGSREGTVSEGSTLAPGESTRPLRRSASSVESREIAPSAGSEAGLRDRSASERSTLAPIANARLLRRSSSLRESPEIAASAESEGGLRDRSASEGSILAPGESTRPLRRSASPREGREIESSAESEAGSLARSPGVAALAGSDRGQAGAAGAGSVRGGAGEGAAGGGQAPSRDRAPAAPQAAADTKPGGKATIRWVCPQPQTEIYLIAGPFSVTARAGPDAEAMAFLRTPDAPLAGRYLEVTGPYLAMYSRLLGPYPYSKFALVENFWETGYGMPSFTLLGSKVIRLPFILHSSYPHEILHNWWGNGVYVAPRGGNWSEGLTAYLADHLIQEQRGAAADYRLTTLQKYADYVAREKDFPLSEFRERHSPSTEAVGYGKAMMLFHALRLELGDETFVAGLRRFYEEHRFRRAGWEDLRRAFEAASGAGLEAVFGQAISRAGAPSLRIGGAAAARAEDSEKGWVLTARLEQTQPGPAWRLRVPLAVTIEGKKEALQEAILMAGKEQAIRLRLPGRPVRVDVDPEFDLFRRLDRQEIPPALSQAFGAPRVTFLLPHDAPDALRAAYRALAEGWSRGEEERVEILSDRDATALPADRSVWLLGWENRFTPAVPGAVETYGARVAEDGVTVDGRAFARAAHSVALTVRHPADPDRVLGWIATDNAAAVPGLLRKLPHYHKYSYLVFQGDEPENVAKGRWPVLDSPMVVLLHGDETAAGDGRQGSATHRERRGTGADESGKPVRGSEPGTAPRAGPAGSERRRTDSLAGGDTRRLGGDESDVADRAEAEKPGETKASAGTGDERRASKEPGSRGGDRAGRAGSNGGGAQAGEGGEAEAGSGEGVVGGAVTGRREHDGTGARRPSAAAAVERGTLARRRPLAELPPLYSADRMMETIRLLAAPGMDGRGLGSEGLGRAAERIAARFREAGLEPLGDEPGSYFQTWTESVEGRPVTLRNVVGVLPGRDPDRKEQSVVLGAHYDHLGRIDPGAEGAEGKGSSGAGGVDHPGADDNASGVAVLLELARLLGESESERGRAIVFAAFTGEEAGRLGSRRYVASERRYPAAQCIAMVNLDSVGRLEGRKPMVLGTGTAREWAPLFRGVGYATGIAVEAVDADPGGSDQVSFHEAGVPAVQIFSGPHLDYHRPSDTPEKIDAEGLITAAAVAREAIDYLAGRPDPLTSMLSGGTAPAAGADAGAAAAPRRASLGTIPDFAYQGEGCRLSGTVPGSPAERAGLREGDIILKVGERAVKGLRDLAEALRENQAGDRVRIVFSRDGREEAVEAVLADR